jgi:hypothetical protein
LHGAVIVVCALLGNGERRAGGLRIATSDSLW